MLGIGIDRDFGLVYEGNRAHGRPVVPTPVTAPAALVSEGDFSPQLPPSYALEQAQMLFREDSFDAVTRARRGRLYYADAARPQTWAVPHHSGLNDMRSVFPFSSLNTPAKLKELVGRGQPLLVIGNDASYTIWTIASIEGTSVGEFLLTLRGRQTFGVLPELDMAAIPAACRKAVTEAVSKLGDEIFRAGPGSIVDRARDAASAVLSGYLQNLGIVGPGKELAELIDKLNSLEGVQRKRIASAAADIVRLFHSREKPSVRERLPVKSSQGAGSRISRNVLGFVVSGAGLGKMALRSAPVQGPARRSRSVVTKPRY